MTDVTWKGTLGHFQKCVAQNQPPRHWRGGWSWATHFNTFQGNGSMFSTSTLCYEDGKINVRNIGTDLQVHFFNNLKMSECPFSRDAGHISLSCHVSFFLSLSPSLSLPVVFYQSSVVVSDFNKSNRNPLISHEILLTILKLPLKRP